MSHKRLDSIVAMVDKDDKVLGVGTDHGFIPIFLFKKGITKEIIASDILEKPLQNAEKNFKKNNLEKEITLIKSNGVKQIPELDKIDTIIIAGLGGKKISEILDQRNEDGQKINSTLILHPTNSQNLLRKILFIKGYKIIDEKIIKENDVFNIIIKAKKSRLNYVSRKNQFLGPILKKQMFENKDIVDYYKIKMDHYWDTYQKSNKKEFLRYYKWLKRILIDYDIKSKK